jgi:hypothetical protein
MSSGGVVQKVWAIRVRGVRVHVEGTLVSRHADHRCRCQSVLQFVESVFMLLYPLQRYVSPLYSVQWGTYAREAPDKPSVVGAQAEKRPVSRRGVDGGGWWRPSPAELQCPLLTVRVQGKRHASGTGNISSRATSDSQPAAAQTLHADVPRKQ